MPGYIAFGAVMKLFTGQPLQLPLVSLERDPSAELERWAGVALPVIAGVELVVAGVILLGGRWARWLALAVMAVFAAVLVPHVRASAESCGCFGAVTTSPVLMLVTALSMGALILLLPCSGEPLRLPGGGKRGRWLAGWAAVSVALVAVVSIGGVPEKLGWRVPTMRLRPETWVGARLADLPFYPMLEHDGGGAAATYPEGEQTWVLYMRTCPHCHEYFRERWGGETDRRVVAVEVPPSARGVRPEPHSIECPSCVRLHLRAGTFYFLPTTPVVLTVRDGLVASVNVNPSSAPGDYLQGSP